MTRPLLIVLLLYASVVVAQEPQAEYTQTSYGEQKVVFDFYFN